MSSTPSISRGIAWTIWVIASAFYAYQYVLRVIPNILLNDIFEKFSFDAASFGQFSGIYYIGYSLMHLPVGIMLDRFGPKRVMSSCILLSILGLLPLLFPGHWGFPVVGRLLVGIGSSAAILGVFKIIRMTFDEKRFARMLSFSATIGLLGAIYGGGPLSYLRESFGYDNLIWLIFWMGVLLALLTFWLVPDMKPEQKTSVLGDIRAVLGEKKVLATCLFAGLMVGPLEGFADVWGTAFLKRVYGFEGSLAANLPSLIFMGMCFGAPFLSLIAEKTRSFQGTVIASAFLMAMVFFFLCFSRLSPGVLGAGFLLVGFCSAYQILAIYLATTFVKEHLAGLTTALANMIIMIFGYGFHTLIGSVVQAWGGPSEPAALVYGTLIIPVALSLGGIGFSLLRAKRQIQTA